MHSVVFLEPRVHGVVSLEAEVWLHDESVVHGDGEAHHVQLDVRPGRERLQGLEEFTLQAQPGYNTDVFSFLQLTSCRLPPVPQS